MESLSGQDRAFLVWESRRRPMHFGAVCSFRLEPGRAMPSVEEVRAAVAAALPGEARLRQRLARRGWTRRPVWVEADDFRIEQHVGACEGISLRDAADRLLAGRLDRSRPLWALWLVRAQPDPTSFSIIVKIHHAVSDGIGAVRLLERVLGARAERAPVRPGPAALRPATRSRTRRPGAWSALARLLRGFLRGSPPTPLTGRVGVARHHRWFPSEAARLDDTAAALATTPNDIVLAASALALRRELAAHPAPRPDVLRAFCPVSLRAGGAGHAGLGNSISLWLVDLPMREMSLRALVTAIGAATTGLRRRGDAAGGAGVARLAERFGAWVSWLGMAVAARRRAFHVVVTNVPGPSRPLHFLDARLASIAPFAPLFPGQRIAIAVVRYDGCLHWGVNDGWRDRVAGDRLALRLRLALDEIADAAGPAAPARRAG